MEKPSRIDEALARWLADGRRQMGQAAIACHEPAGFSVCHQDDVERLDLAKSSDLEEAGAIAIFDDAGVYRPLKTAPNLRHGWRLDLAGLADLRRALDLLYPGRLAAFLAWEEERLATTSLRGTLARQSGMYRVTQKISEADADLLVGRFCRSESGCLRAILWPRDDAGAVASEALPPQKFMPLHDQTGHDACAIPLLCQEACNLLVAEARKVVKGE